MYNPSESVGRSGRRGSLIVAIPLRVCKSNPAARSPDPGDSAADAVDAGFAVGAELAKLAE